MNVEAMATHSSAPPAPTEGLQNAGICLSELTDDEILALLEDCTDLSEGQSELSGGELQWLDEIALWLDEGEGGLGLGLSPASGEGTTGVAAAWSTSERPVASSVAAGVMNAQAVVAPGARRESLGERELIARDLKAVQQARAAVARGLALQGSALAAAACGRT